MAQKINYRQLMELSEERIRPYLPDMYEMDDMDFDEDEEIFQISVYDCSRPEFAENDGFIDYGPADRFRFYRMPGETDEALMERWNRELQEFCESW